MMPLVWVHVCVRARSRGIHFPSVFRETHFRQGVRLSCLAHARQPLAANNGPVSSVVCCGASAKQLSTTANDSHHYEGETGSRTRARARNGVNRRARWRNVSRTNEQVAPSCLGRFSRRIDQNRVSRSLCPAPIWLVRCLLCLCVCLRRAS